MSIPDLEEKARALYLQCASYVAELHIMAAKRDERDKPMARDYQLLSEELRSQFELTIRQLKVLYDQQRAPPPPLSAAAVRGIRDPGQSLREPPRRNNDGAELSEAEKFKRQSMERYRQ